MHELVVLLFCVIVVGVVRAIVIETILLKVVFVVVVDTRKFPVAFLLMELLVKDMLAVVLFDETLPSRAVIDLFFGRMEFEFSD